MTSTLSSNCVGGCEDVSSDFVRDCVGGCEGVPGEVSSDVPCWGLSAVFDCNCEGASDCVGVSDRVTSDCVGGCSSLSGALSLDCVGGCEGVLCDCVPFAEIVCRAFGGRGWFL